MLLQAITLNIFYYFPTSSIGTIQLQPSRQSLRMNATCKLCKMLFASIVQQRLISISGLVPSWCSPSLCLSRCQCRYQIWVTLKRRPKQLEQQQQQIALIWFEKGGFSVIAPFTPSWKKQKIRSHTNTSDLTHLRCPLKHTSDWLNRICNVC